MARIANSIKFLAVVSSPKEAAVPLNNWLASGDYVLLKASRGVALEKLLEHLNATDS